MANNIVEGVLKIINTLPPVLAAGTLVFIAHMYFEAEIWNHLDVDPGCGDGAPECLDVYSTLSTRVVAMLEARGESLKWLFFIIVGAALATAPWRGRGGSAGDQRNGTGKSEPTNEPGSGRRVRVT